MFSNVGLTKSFRAETVSTSCYLINHGSHIESGGVEKQVEQGIT